MALILKHQTAAQFIARFVEQFRIAKRDRAILLAKFVLIKLQSGDITDAQFRNALNLTVTEWNTLKTKLQNWVDHYTAIQDAAGE